MTEHRSTCGTARVSLGAYVLNALELDDKLSVERHLSDCAGCVGELAQLETLPPLLAMIDRDLIEDLLNPDRTPPLPPSPPSPPSPWPAMPTGLVADLAPYRLRPRRRVLLATAAAVVMLIAAPVVAVNLIHDSRSSSSSLSAFAQSLFATDSSTATNATISVSPREWGTRVSMKLSNVPGGNVCELLAVGRDGKRAVVASWRVRPGGYTGSDTLTIEGSVATRLADIEQFEVVTASGHQLVAVAP